MMFSLPRNVWILTLSLALFLSLNVFVIFIGGIVGKSLSPNVSLSTLPVAMIVVGTAFSIVPMVRLMSKIGRKKVFLGVCVSTILVIGLAILALVEQSFVLFCVAAFLFGMTVATMNQFRFAAMESVSPEQAASATSVVLLGGLFSAFIGPELAVRGKDWFEVPFVGSFVLLSGLFVLAFILLLGFKPAKKFVAKQGALHRSLLEIIKQPVFIVAVSSATVGYAVMSYIMTATPVSMHVMDGFSLHETKFVIQSHVVAMFLPSLFTPFIVKWMGASRMMLVGVIMYFICVVVGYLDHQLLNYWVALAFLGLGWNFLFIGGTLLLPRAYHEDEKYKVQSMNDFMVFSVQAFASLSAGWFVFNYGWEVVLLSVLPFLALQFVMLVWWMGKKNG